MISNKCSENRMKPEWNSIENNKMLPHCILHNEPIFWPMLIQYIKKQNSDSVQICLNE